MKGFVFTIDSLFAVVVSITIALSFYSLLEQMDAEPVGNHAELDILSALDKMGGIDSVSPRELETMLSTYNKCGTLTIRTNGRTVREVVACGCNSDEFYSGARSFVRHSIDGKYSVAVLRTCLKVD
ncbi:MAG: hypothetical protein ABIG39_02065 [Candidatus Micrarchaeota archaeon]